MTRLLIIDPDTIFRLGLRTMCEQFAGLQVMADVADPVTGLQFCREHPTTLDLIIIDWEELNSGVAFCQELKTLDSNIRLLLLSREKTLNELAVARQIGIHGYCPKGMMGTALISVIEQVAAGGEYWQSSVITTQKPQLLTRWRSQLGRSGLRQIERNLTTIKTDLDNLGLLPAGDWRQLLDRAILQGQQRELLAAQWLIRQLLSVAETEPQPQPFIQSPLETEPPAEPGEPPTSLILRTKSGRELLPPETVTDLQTALFDTTVAKLQSGLINLTNIPLEIDILRREKRQELMLIILRHWENILDELRFSQVQRSQLLSKRNLLLLDVWESVITDFFGKYYTVNYSRIEVIFPTSDLPSIPSMNSQEPLVPRLLERASQVEQVILNKIPFVVEWLEHLLFQVPLVIDNHVHEVGSPEAMKRAELVLENLMIQMANAVIQPLLNQFANVEEIKQGFYDRRLVSTREIERFRNQLSWKYRLQEYFVEPKAIFESRLELLSLNERGIQKVSVYAPRHPELEELSGVQLVITLALETRDAIAPQIRSVIALVGAGVVYLLTQVIGRGIGLIGRGVLQGIGKSIKN